MPARQKSKTKSSQLPRPRRKPVALAHGSKLARTTRAMSDPSAGVSKVQKNDLAGGIQGELISRSKTASESGVRVKKISLQNLMALVVDDPQIWLSTPNLQFGGRKPQDLVGTPEERCLFDVLHAVDQGLF